MCILVSLPLREVGRAFGYSSLCVNQISRKLESSRNPFHPSSLIHASLLHKDMFRLRGPIRFVCLLRQLSVKRVRYSYHTRVQFEGATTAETRGVARG